MRKKSNRLMDIKIDRSTTQNIMFIRDQNPNKNKVNDLKKKVKERDYKNHFRTVFRMIGRNSSRRYNLLKIKNKTS